MTIERAGEIRRLLDEPATWLLAAGCADPFTTPPAVRLHCLQAVEQLRAAGARPARTLGPLASESVAGMIRDAHRYLNLLPVELSLEAAVLEAIREVRAVLDELD